MPRVVPGDGCTTGCAQFAFVLLLYFTYKYLPGTGATGLLILLLIVFAVVARINRGGWWTPF